MAVFRQSRAAVSGVGSLVAAADLLRRTPRLRRYVVVPILVNLVVAAALYGALATAGLRVVDAVVGDVQGSLAALAALLQVVVLLLLLFVVGFLLVRFGVVLGAPWYGRLSVEVEALRTGQPSVDEPFTLRGAARDLGRAVGYEARKLTLVGGAGLGILLLNLVPVAGQAVGGAAALGLGAVVACLDFFEGPMERSKLPFAAKLGVVRRTAPGSLAFGAACVGLLAVPLVNLLSLPLCVVAGTLFVVDRRADGRGAPARGQDGGSGGASGSRGGWYSRAAGTDTRADSG